MASLTGQNFDGSTGFTDSHDITQSEIGNATWFNECMHRLVQDTYMVE